MFKKAVQFIFKNFWYKLGSLALAIFVWGIVQGEEVVERNRRIKITISVANGYAVRGEPVRYLDATLRGPRVLLGEMNSDYLEAKVYIAAGDTGNIEIPFERRFIKDLDHRIKLTMRDSYINVFVDERISRDVDIREVLVGAPAEGFFIERVVISPPRIKVTGIKADVLRMDEIPTEPIDISKLNQSKSFEVGLVSGALDPKALETDRVRVKVQLGDSKINKRFSAIPIEVVGSEYAAEVRPTNVSIVIQGTPGVLSFVNREDLRAFVELTNMGPGRYEREIQVKIPPDTVLIETSPAKGMVEVFSHKKVN